VESLQQLDREVYRAVVLGPDGRELLVVAHDRGLLLPWVDIPRDQRLAESLTRAMKNEWGCETICLFTPDLPSSAGGTSGVCYQVMECCDKTHDLRTKWVLVSSLLPGDFAKVADYAAVVQSVVECLADVGGEAPGPFARIGWLTQLQEWVEEVVTPLGLHLNGSFCQLNASPCFSLIRFETNGPAIWFKAVGKPNLREFPITLTLADLFPKYIPPILATRSAWHGWLTREVEGTNLGEKNDLRRWKDAASSLAQMQIESIGHGPHILQCGARDLRASGLANLVDPFLDVMDRLMGQQMKAQPVVLSSKELLLLGEHVLDALSALPELGIPDALGHLDLNPWNIVVTTEACAFLDWAEAYVGHPFFSFQYLLEHFRSAVGIDRSLEAQLADSYAEPWRDVVCANAIAEALRLAPMLAVFAYAAGTGSWADRERLRQPNTGGFLRGLTRRLSREANQAMDRGAQCLG
jgi:hypothetical protein